MKIVEFVAFYFTFFPYLYKAELQLETDCGCRFERIKDSEFSKNGNSRSGKIIAGVPTEEGQFPWQASLELLHPSLGFLGHWCGGVLIHEYWVLSAAHCIHNDMFNLPIPPLWTIVLGEHNRFVESGVEQRIPVEKIILHKRYENFQNDLVLMKLSKPANMSYNSAVRRICLPLVPDIPLDYDGFGDSQNESQQFLNWPDLDPLQSEILSVSENIDNFLRSFESRTNVQTISIPSMNELITLKIVSRLKRLQIGNFSKNKTENGNRVTTVRHNDKLLRIKQQPTTHKELDRFPSQKRSEKILAFSELPYIECIATGWGKENITGDLTEILLKTTVPLHNNKRCKEVYGSFVKIHKGHLCAGNLNGKGGTCVGDSGGPLQCRLTKSGPWILAGITSFGSGCAIKGYPDVYTRTSFYIKWIKNTIAYS